MCPVAVIWGEARRAACSMVLSGPQPSWMILPGNTGIPIKFSPLSSSIDVSLWNTDTAFYIWEFRQHRTGKRSAVEHQGEQFVRQEDNIYITIDTKQILEPHLIENGDLGRNSSTAWWETGEGVETSWVFYLQDLAFCIFRSSLLFLHSIHSFSRYFIKMPTICSVWCLVLGCQSE